MNVSHITSNWVVFQVLLLSTIGTATLVNTNPEETSSYEDFLVAACSQKGPILHFVHSSLPLEPPSEPINVSKSTLKSVCCSFTVFNALLIDDGFKYDLCIINGSHLLEVRLQTLQAPLIWNWLEPGTKYEASTCSSGEITFCQEEAETSSDEGLPRPEPLEMSHKRRHSRHSNPLYRSKRLITQKYLIANVKSDPLEKCENVSGYFGKKRNHKVKRDINFIIEFAPVIGIPEKDIIIHKALEELVLVCVIKAFPAPVVRWMKDNQTFPDAGRNEWGLNATNNETSYSISTETRSSCLVVSTFRTKVINWQSLGNYGCSAENVYGATSAFFLITAKSSNIFSPKLKQFNVTGFILGMMPPLLIGFYFILKLGYRSRYAVERPEEDDVSDEPFF